jgi:hypothetical protein
MELFDVIKNIFSSDNKKWNSIGAIDKSRNFFMINRVMSIQFPLQANQFNKLRVTPVPVVDWWRNTLSHRFTKPPSWIYTKTKKKDDPKKDEKLIDFSESEDFIREKYQVSKKDMIQIKKFYPDKYREWVTDVSDQLGLKNNKL